jgi:hypothetical protein
MDRLSRRSCSITSRTNTASRERLRLTISGAIRWTSATKPMRSNQKSLAPTPGRSSDAGRVTNAATLPALVAISVQPARRVNNEKPALELWSAGRLPGRSRVAGHPWTESFGWSDDATRARCGWDGASSLAEPGAAMLQAFSPAFPVPGEPDSLQAREGR